VRPRLATVIPSRQTQQHRRVWYVFPARSPNEYLMRAE
jgi:hypothetical protein